MTIDLDKSQPPAAHDTLEKATVQQNLEEMPGGRYAQHHAGKQ